MGKNEHCMCLFLFVLQVSCAWVKVVLYLYRKTEFSVFGMENLHVIKDFVLQLVCDQTRQSDCFFALICHWELQQIIFLMILLQFCGIVCFSSKHASTIIFGFPVLAVTKR